MVRRINFAHIPIRGETKEEIDKLKRELEKQLDSPTYDELINIFLEKNKKITMSREEIKKLILKSRGILI